MTEDTPDSSTSQSPLENQVEPDENTDTNRIETTGETTEPSNEDSVAASHPEPYGIIGTYRYGRYMFITQVPFGHLIWDVFRVIAGVLLVAGILFALTGMTTPFVSVMSGSMEPNINTGDLVLVTEYDPENPPPLAGHGEIIPVDEAGDDYTSFGNPGTVIVYEQAGEDMPILHRAHMEVEQGDDWVADADPDLLAGASSCDEVTTCPAPHDGYITAGDANGQYDQVGNAPVVEEDNVIAIVQYRVPFAGWLRNMVEQLFFITTIAFAASNHGKNSW